MAPDPFDYSGPVPNGSVTQNNFAARSNGILPLHASPKPWPLIVKSSNESERSKTGPGAVAVASYDSDDVRPDSGQPETESED
ncbi:MAG: hypothetical protein ABGW78_06265 [Pirellulales bacterium]